MNLIKLNATNSSNSYLKELIKKQAVPDETIVIAEHQISGRGQHGNSWYSTAEESITFSIYKKFNHLKVQEHFKIAMLVSLALIKEFDNLNIPKLKIKWPNDILSDRKKIAGILVENTLSQKNIKHAIIGIGINVNHNSMPGLPQASSLKMQSGEKVDKEQLLLNVANTCIASLNKIELTTYSQLQKQYEQYLFQKDKISVFENLENEERFNAIIRGITEFGFLRIETESGFKKQVGIKELRLLY